MHSITHTLVRVMTSTVAALVVGCSGPSVAPTPALSACQGACSHHDGINCNAGPGNRGQVLCADGWAGSSVPYTECCPAQP